MWLLCINSYSRGIYFSYILDKAIKKEFDLLMLNLNILEFFFFFLPHWSLWSLEMEIRKDYCLLLGFECCIWCLCNLQVKHAGMYPEGTAQGQNPRGECIQFPIPYSEQILGSSVTAQCDLVSVAQLHSWKSLFIWEKKKKLLLFDFVVAVGIHSQTHFDERSKSHICKVWLGSNS